MFEGMMQEEGGSDPSVGIGQGREQVATLGWAAGKGGRGGGLEEGATTQDGWWPWGAATPRVRVSRSEKRLGSNYHIRGRDKPQKMIISYMHNVLHILGRGVENPKPRYVNREKPSEGGSGALGGPREGATHHPM
jgi:hypothetical protein